jgi:hypothetical protein
LLRGGGNPGRVQACDLMTHPIPEQPVKHEFEKNRAATNAAHKCSYCCHRMLLGLLRHASLLFATCKLFAARKGKYGGSEQAPIQIATRLSRS